MDKRKHRQRRVVHQLPNTTTRVHEAVGLQHRNSKKPVSFRTASGRPTEKSYLHSSFNAHSIFIAARRANETSHARPAGSAVQRGGELNVHPLCTHARTRAPVTLNTSWHALNNIFRRRLGKSGTSFSGDVRLELTDCAMNSGGFTGGGRQPPVTVTEKKQREGGSGLTLVYLQRDILKVIYKSLFTNQW